MAELIKIQMLRGTKAQIISAGSGDAGKPFFATDTGEIFVADGTTKHLAGKVQFDAVANRPTAHVIITGKLYYATDEDILYICNGSTWQVVATQHLSGMQGSLDDIADGTVYGKVKLDELASGQVKRVRATTAGVDVTGDQINTHITDATKHRQINDSGASSTELWSSYKIQQELSAIITGMQRQKMVLDRLSAPPATPAVGDRYLITATPSGAWVGNANKIAEWGGSAWLYTAPTEGMVVYNDQSNTDWLYVDDGTPGWEERATGVTAHNDLSGLNDGDYKHLTAAEYTKATSVATTSTDGLMSSTDKSKLDGIEAGAQVNQTIITGVGVVGAESPGSNGDITIDVDFEDADANIQAVLKGAGVGEAGTSNKVARADHQHRMVDVDAGSL